MKLRHSVQPIPGTQFVDPATLARIQNLELLARNVVDGFINGLHRAPYLGLSVDFAEHRSYNPGDDIRRIDWRLYARTDRYFVKEFEADTNSNFMVLLDVSGSMGYGSTGISKLDYGKYLGASLAYFSREQRDRVGMITFADDIRTYVPASAKHLDVVLHTMDRAQAQGTSNIPGTVRKITELLRRRGLVVLISDLYEEPERLQTAIGLLRHRGNDVIVFHVLDPAEIEFPFEDLASFQDLESGELLPVVPESLRARYRQLMQDHIAAVRKALSDARIDYTMVRTDTPLDHALFSYLSAREHMTRAAKRSGARAR